MPFPTFHCTHPCCLFRLCVSCCDCSPWNKSTHDWIIWRWFLTLFPSSTWNLVETQNFSLLINRNFALIYSVINCSRISIQTESHSLMKVPLPWNKSFVREPSIAILNFGRSPRLADFILFEANKLSWVAKSKRFHLLLMQIFIPPLLAIGLRS